MRQRLRSTAIALALAVVLATCTGEPVKLLTYGGPVGLAACCVPYVAGPLLPDEEVGTVLRVEEESQGWGEVLVPTKDVRLVPVTWPVGHTGRWAGSEVEVLNGRGEVVARTGERHVLVQITGGHWWWDASEATGDSP